MENHVIKIKPKNPSTKLDSVVDSEVLSLLSDKEMRSKAAIISLVRTQRVNLQEKDIQAALESLERKGFVQVINGIRLARFLESIR